MKLKQYMTTFAAGTAESEYETDFMTDRRVENEVINIYPHIRKQKWQGFGGAATDAAGYVYSLMSAEQKRRFISEYFGIDKMNYTCVRVPVDSCDFSLESFQSSYREEDSGVCSVSYEREERYIMPLLKDIKEYTKNRIELLLTPWSPPDHMKDNGSRTGGGHLLKDQYRAYADFLCGYAEEFISAGFNVTRICMQNEQAAVQTWDSCIVSAAEEADFISGFLYPAMKRHGLDSIKICIWDHNKERLYERTDAEMCSEAGRYISGAAFHWYSGDHFEAVSLVSDKYPQLELIMTEACIEYSKFSSEKQWENVSHYMHDIIGNANAGMNSFYDWNLILDENGGPNYAENYCDAPFMYHIGSNELEERQTLKAIGHFSRFIHSGDEMTAFSKYTDKLEFTAFSSQDGTISCIAFNPQDKKMKAVIRIGEECAEIMLNGHSCSTLVIA